MQAHMTNRCISDSNKKPAKCPNSLKLGMALKRAERYSFMENASKRPAVDLDKLYQEFLSSESEEAVDALPVPATEPIQQAMKPLSVTSSVQDQQNPDLWSSNATGEGDSSEVTIDDFINCDKLSESSSIDSDASKQKHVPLCGFRDRRLPYVVSNDIPRRNIQAAWTLAGRDITARSQEELIESIMMYATSFYPTSMLSGHARQTMV